MDSRNRFQFIDLLRGVSAAVMIEALIFNTFLLPEFRGDLWFRFLNFINSLAAPSFIFISGFAFIISTRRDLDEIRQFRWKFWRKLGRILLLFLAGYSLHLPFFSLSGLFTMASPADIKGLCNVDALQCIAAGLLVLFIARVLIRSDRIFHLFNITITLLLTLCAPVIWNTDFTGSMPLPLACYLNEMHGSKFPVFPWAGFVFAGAAVSAYFTRAHDTFREKDFMKKLSVFGLTSAVSCFIILAWLDTLPWFHLKPSPLFFLQMFGSVAVLLFACWYYYRRTGAEAGFFIDFSRQTLVVYWLHIQIISRRIWNGRSLASMAGGSFGIDECLLATAILLSAMMTVAYVWGQIKEERPDFAKKIFYVTTYGALAVFFII